MNVVLNFHQAPGDTLCASAAIASLKRQHPDRFRVAVMGTAADAIYQNNPYVDKVAQVDLLVRMDNPLILKSHLPHHILQSYCVTLAEALGVSVELEFSRPLVYLGEDETVNQDEPYWVVCRPGAKRDYTVKRWPNEYLQQVIDRTKDGIRWLQVGGLEHEHVPLNGTVNLLGRTDTRGLLRLIGSPLCQGVLCGDSFPWHVAAAFRKPAVCIASGWLSKAWISYPTGVVLSRHGCLPCCREQACGKTRTVALNDDDPKDKNLCTLPVLDLSEPVPACMALVLPEEVIHSINMFNLGK